MVENINQNLNSKKNEFTGKKNLIKRLNSEYPRFERDYSFEPIEDEEEWLFYDEMLRSDEKFFESLNLNLEEAYVNVAAELYLYKLAKTMEDEGFVKLHLQDDLTTKQSLELFYYLTLKQAYNMPDPLIFIFHDSYGINYPKIKSKIIPIIYSYVLKIGNGLYLEFEKNKDTLDLKISYWMLQSQFNDNNYENDVSLKLAEFFKLLNSLLVIVDNDYPDKKINDKINYEFRLAQNVYFKHIKNAEELLKISKNYSVNYSIEDRKISSIAKSIPQKNYSITSSLNLATTVFYIMALEAFINLLYEFLLKPEFNNNENKKTIKGQSFEIKLLSLPEYCLGFKKVEISKKDDILKNWYKIRSFRNDFIHSNLMSETDAYTVREDFIPFIYSESVHRKLYKNKLNPYINSEKCVETIRESVKAIVTGIIKKMNKNEKLWAISWLNYKYILTYDAILHLGPIGLSELRSMSD